MRYYRNFQLKNYNSFGLQSTAGEAWLPESIEELQELVIKLKGMKFFVLAGGKNVLLKPKIDKIICLNLMPQYLYFLPIGINISANYSTSYLVSKAIEYQFKDIEGLYGIPGTIGGAITMNAGSGGYTISDYLVSVTTINLEGSLYITDKKSLQFGRRYSILQDNNNIIISAHFNFKRGNVDLNKLKQVKDYRKNFPKGYSVGGIFKNWYALKPYEKEIRAIKSPNLVISKYLNLIINNGKATFEETIDFINQIRKIVKEPLELEVKILGDK